MNTMLPNKAWILSRSEAKMSDLVTNLRNGYLTTCISSWDAQRQKEQLMLQAAAEIEKNDVQRTNLLNALAAKDAEIERLQREFVESLAADHATIERLTAELAAAKAKHYEECAVIAKGCNSGFGAASYIRAALTDTPAGPQHSERKP